MPQYHPEEPPQHPCDVHLITSDGELVTSRMLERILALSYVPVVTLVIGGCGTDPQSAPEHDDATEVEAVTRTLELVAQFSFTGAAGNEVKFAASVADPALAAIPAMSRGTGVTPSPATDAFSASGWTTGLALDPNDFYSFAVAPGAGHSLNVRALQLDERRSATGIRRWSVRSSLDGFATDIAVFKVPDNTLTRTEIAEFPAQFHGLTTPVEFRIYGFRAEAAGGTWRIDNVTLFGGVAPAIVAPLYVKASNTDAQDQFGFSVALSADGSTMAVGALGESSGTGDPADNSVAIAGAVYVFERAGDSWIQQAYLKAPSTDEFDEFGYSVALSANGSTLVVGAPFEDSAATGIDGDAVDNSAQNAGAVYVFARSGATWIQQAYVKASNTGAGDSFGSGVAISSDGSTLAVGAPFEASAATVINGDQSDDSANVNGAVYVFARTGATWIQQAYVKASHLTGLFGDSVALSADGTTLAVGADLDRSAATGINGDPSDNSAFASGAAFVFTRSGLTWSQQAYVKASNTGASDRFGRSIAVSTDGSTLAVGAFNEASAATGINGNQADDSATGAGAVYVFTRSAATWSQQAYVKASNAGANDSFGAALALSADGSTLAVGSPLEASAATGLGGDETSNAAPNAGAVYLFARSGTAWSQQVYVKASNTGVGDRFGVSVALPHDATIMAVGAQGEASAATGIGGDQADNSRFAAGAVYVYRPITARPLQRFASLAVTSDSGSGDKRPDAPGRPQ